jgi:hypothetical protein
MSDKNLTRNFKFSTLSDSYKMCKLRPEEIS